MLFLSKVVSNVPMTDIVSRLGSKPVLLASTALLGISLGGLSFVSSFEHLMICRAVGGVAVAGLSASIAAPLIAVQTSLNRTRSGAPFNQAMNAGIALGPAVGGILAGFVGMEVAFACIGASFFLATFATSRIYVELASPKGSNVAKPSQLFTNAFSSWHDVVKESSEIRSLCLAQLALFAAVGGTNMTLLPSLLAGEPLSLTGFMIGAVSSAVATVAIVVAQPLAIFADKYGRRTALGLGSAVMGASLAVVPFVGSPAWMLGTLACTAVGQNLLGPSINALTLDAVAKKGPEQMTQAMSLMRTLQDLGTVGGAFAIGAIGDEFGFSVGYEVSSSVVLAMGLFAFMRLPSLQPNVRI